MFGILLGSVLANSLQEDNRQLLTGFINKFFVNYNFLNTDSSEIFRESFIKYGKIILIIWILAFISMGFVISGFIVFLKGISYGFTTAFLIITYGTKGIYYACFLYLLQNIILIPAYVFIMFASIKFVFKKNTETLDSFFEYTISMLISLACVIIVCLLEAYVIPNFITFL